MPQKTPTYEQALLFLEILKILPRHRKITQAEIMQSLKLCGYKIDTQKLQRIMRQMCECEALGVECDQRSKPYGYRSISKDAFSQAKLTEEESLLLLLVRSHLQNQLPGTLQDALTPLFEASEQLLNDCSNHYHAKAWLNKVAVIPNTIQFAPPTVRPRVFKTVTNALYSERMLEIKYLKPENESKIYIVNPIALVEQDVRLYLVCTYVGSDQIRHLALHRIHDAYPLERNAVVPEGFDLQTYLKSVPFNYTFRPTRYIHLSIELTNPYSIVNLRETPFNDTQRITKLDQNLWRVEADVIDSMLLDGWLATWRDEYGIQSVHKEPINK